VSRNSVRIKRKTAAAARGARDRSHGIVAAGRRSPPGPRVTRHAPRAARPTRHAQRGPSPSLVCSTMAAATGTRIRRVFQILAAIRERTSLDVDKVEARVRIMDDTLGLSVPPCHRSRQHSTE
jgi:hypothetical protein